MMTDKDARKIEPAMLELRARPRPVKSLNRLAIVLGAAFVIVALIAATLVALHPPELFRRSDYADVVNTDRKQIADGLAKLPKDYSRLEPLQTTQAYFPMLSPKPSIAPTAEPMNGHDEEADKEEQQRLARLAIQAKESGLLIKLSQPFDRQMWQPQKQGTEEAAERALRPDRQRTDEREANQIAAGLPVAQMHKIAFLNQGTDRGDRNGHELQVPPSPYMLMAGTIIAASLITGISSDLPGQAIAQVTENVFDSVTGEHLLVPQGARLIGQYDSVIAFGQKRALLIWTRLIMPNGASIRLDNLPGTDRSGYAGLEDGVDYHAYQLLKGIGLATILGVGTQLTIGGNTQTDLVTALRQSIQQSTDQAGQKIVERELDVQPTLTIRPGFPLRVIVAKDLVLAPYRVSGERAAALPSLP
jgi:type IV secretion system protein VirB10